MSDCCSPFVPDAGGSAGGATSTASAGGGVAIVAGTEIASTGTVVFSNSNGVSFGMSDTSVVTASFAAIKSLAGGTTLATGPSVSFANSNGVSFGVNGNTITASISAGAPNGSEPDFENLRYQLGLANITNLTGLSERPFFVPFYLPYSITAQRLAFSASQAVAGSSVSFSVTAGLYTYVNSTQISLLGSFSNSYSATDTANVSGFRQFRMTGFPAAATALSPGHYVLGMHFHTLGATGSMNYNLLGASVGTYLGILDPGADQSITATAQVSSAGAAFLGRYSTTTASLPNTIADADLLKGNTGTIVGIPMWFRLARTA